MIFNSLSFAAFLAVVLILYHLPLAWRARKLILLIASYIFYMAWNAPFVAVLWLSTFTDWYIARAIFHSETAARRKALLVASLVVNLGLLAFFKYSGFAVENFSALLGMLGVDYQPAAPDLILPLGLSFYTFQTLSYSIDVYRRQAALSRSFLDYALYVTFFPQLVAGPIVRSEAFLPQCARARRVTAAAWQLGLSLLSLGLFQKIVLADSLLAPVVDRLFDAEHIPDVAGAWLGTIAFSGQIFCDFSGYSSCAIGLALCLGFVLPANFRSPYASIGFSDFWQRWHISLSTWLRDYLYISMGGNRRGGLRTYSNLMLTMLIGGLWHGASWSFVVWGGLHGAYLALERALREHLPAFRTRSPGSRRLGRAALGALTFLVVSATWTFFRTDLSRALEISAALVGIGRGSGVAVHAPFDYLATACVMVPLLVAHAVLRKDSFEGQVARVPWWLQSFALAGMWLAIATAPKSDRAFIYFQF